MRARLWVVAVSVAGLVGGAGCDGCGDDDGPGMMGDGGTVSCETDEDCGDGICRDGTCTGPPCETDEDCGEGSICVAGYCEPEGGPATEAPVARVVVDPERIAFGDDFATTVTLDGRTSTGGGLSYRWNVPDAMFVGGTGAEDPMVQVTFPGSADHEISLVVRNSFGAASAVATVRTNRPPTADATGGGVVDTGSEVILDGSGSFDPDDDPLSHTWTLASAPDGSSASVSGSGDSATLVPDVFGIYSVELVVGDGLNDSEPVSVSVMAIPPERDGPTVMVTATPRVIAAGGTSRVCASASDPSGGTSLSVEVDGAPLSLGGDGCADASAPSVGRYHVIARATDRYGNRGRAETEYFGRSATDDGGPTVSISTPANGATVDRITDVVGTATDSDLVFYRLEARPDASTDWREFASGDMAVTSGVLGEVNPGAFVPGDYDVRLCALDSWGTEACTPTRNWSFSGGADAGVFRLSFADAVLNAGGVPIVATRHYDSRESRSLDFGWGWWLEFDFFAEFEPDSDPSTGWTDTGCTTFPFSPNIAATRTHLYIVRLGDEEHRFQLVMDPGACGSGYAEVIPRYEALPGTTASLAEVSPPVRGDLILSFTTEQVTDWSFDPYAPDAFVMTKADGTRVDLSVSAGVTRITYPGGEVVDLSGGGGLDFDRDGMSRVTAITDASGRTRTYTYDSRGDLTASTDFDGVETRYLYDEEHRLISVHDPRGGVPGMVEYGEDGRVIAYVDPTGRRVELEHDDAARSEVVTDRLGNRTILFYDEFGNVIREVDPLGNEREWEYDSEGRMLSVTDASGAVTRYEYDSSGNQDAVIDPLGNRWERDFDADGNPTAERDPLGNARLYDYGTEGNVTAVTEPGGARTDLSYDADGRNAGIQFPDGTSMAVAYDANGQLQTFTNVHGRTTTVSRDAAGRITADDSSVDIDGTTRDRSYSYDYDGSGALTSITYPDGTSSAFGMNGAGQIEEATAPDGASQRIEYDPQGRARRAVGPEGTSFGSRFDAAGRVTAVELPNGGLLTSTLDAVGRPTELRTPSGNVLEYTYDATGRLSGVTDGMGRSSGTTYDAAGRPSEVTRADGTTVAYEYDAAGRTTRIVDARGEHTDFAYDADGRVTAVTYATGATESTDYDVMGRATRVTTRTGRTVDYTWDDGDRPLTATDAAGTTSYEYDGLGNLLRITSPSGLVYRNHYDETGSLASVSGGPFTEPETYATAADGTVRITEPTGGTIDMVLDAEGRPLSRVASDGTEERREYASSGAVRSLTTNAGTFRYAYDADGRLTSLAAPGGVFTTHAWDVAGMVTETGTPGGTTTYEWAATAQVTGVVDAAGGRADYAYDAAGQLTSVTLPNDVAAGYEYGAGGLVSRVAYTDGSGTVLFEESYTRDDAGRIVTITSATEGTTGYLYDADGRIASEMPPGASRVDYSYDADGNLVGRGSTSLDYDANGRLVSFGGDTLGWDAAGRLVSREIGGVTERYAYDGLGRLSAIDREGGTPARVEIEYGPDDLISEVRVDDQVRRLAWDRSSQHPVVAEEVDELGTTLVRYTWGPDGALSRQEADGTIRYFLRDARNSIRAEIDGSGAITSSARYDAWGAVTGGSEGVDGNLGFRGEWTLPGTDLVFMRARFYEPRSGRFITPDPVDPEPMEPLTLNRYLYAQADPVNLTDPSGELSMGNVMTAISIGSMLMSIAVTVFPDLPDLLNDAVGFGDMLGNIAEKMAIVGITGEIGGQIFGPKGRSRALGKLRQRSGIGAILGMLHWNAGLDVRLPFLSDRVSVEPWVALSLKAVFGDIRWEFWRNTNKKGFDRDSMKAGILFDERDWKPEGRNWLIFDLVICGTLSPTYLLDRMGPGVNYGLGPVQRATALRALWLRFRRWVARAVEHVQLCGKLYPSLKAKSLRGKLKTRTSIRKTWSLEVRAKVTIYRVSVNLGWDFTRGSFEDAFSQIQTFFERYVGDG